jgi:hypothetical protein
MEFDIRIRRCGIAPAGVATTIAATDTDLSTSYSEVPTLGFTASTVVTGALPDGSELRVELWDGGTWVEPEHGRYIVAGSDVDEADPTMTTRFTAVSWSSYLLSKATLHSADGGERVWTDSVPGLLLDHLFDEAFARGWAADGQLVWTFNSLTDSNGEPWAAETKTTISFMAGQTYLEIIQALFEAGAMEWGTNGREIWAVNPGTGPDYTAGPTQIYVGRQALERPMQTSITDLATAITMRADDGTGGVFTQTPALPALGRLERELTASGVQDQSTLELLSQIELTRGLPQSMHTVTENMSALDARPLLDYELGSWVNVRRVRTGSWERMRVLEAQMRKQSDNTVAVDLILQDRLGSLTERLTRRAAMLGASASGNGRYKAGSGSGSGAFKLATISDNYSGGGAPAPVLFEGSTETSGPYPFLSSYYPAKGDKVAIGSVGSTGDVILGRISSDGNGVDAGTGEVLELATGWNAWDPGRYGEPTIRRMSSDWVMLSGALVAEAGATDLTLNVPGGFRPMRTDLMTYVTTHQDTSGGTLILLSKFDPDTGTLKMLDSDGGPYAPYVGQVIFLNGIWWNIKTDGIVVVGDDLGSPTMYSVADVDGTVSLFGNVSKATGVTLPAELQPAAPKTVLIASTAGPSRNHIVRPIEVPASGSWSYTERNYPDAAFWQSAVAPTYTWTTLTLINGFTHVAGKEVQWAKTPSGIVMIRGSYTGGVTGQAMAVLPRGARPSFEQVFPGSTRITAGGSIIQAGTLRILHAMFPAGR